MRFRPRPVPDTVSSLTYEIVKKLERLVELDKEVRAISAEVDELGRRAEKLKMTESRQE